MGKMVEAGAEIFDKLEPELEPKFLTSRSRSRTKMDRLRNTEKNKTGTKTCFGVGPVSARTGVYGCSTKCLLS
jgi:hypothetical protein